MSFTGWHVEFASCVGSTLITISREEGEVVFFGVCVCVCTCPLY